MPLLIECPSGHRLKVPSKLAGHSIVCPVCEEKVSVPPLAPPPKPLLRPVTKPTKATAPDRSALLSSGDESLSAKLTPTETKPSHPERVERPEKNTDGQSVNRAGMTEPIHTSDPTEPQSFEPQQLESSVSQPQFDSLPSEPQSPLDIESAQTTSADVPNQFVLPDSEQSRSPSQFELFDSMAEEGNESLAWVFDVEPVPKHSSARSNVPYARRFGVLALGIAAIAVSVFCAIPSIMDQVLARRMGAHAPDSWTYFVLLASVIQIAIALYAMWLPDWSTSWVASVTTTGFAAMYALGLALTMFASQEHQLVRDLGLLDEAFRYQAQLWCFLVMCMTLILAFFYGRFSLQWYQADKQLAANAS